MFDLRVRLAVLAHGAAALFIASTAPISLYAEESETNRGESAAEPAIVLPPVVVSARKRPENLQDVPLSVTVSSGDSLGPGKRYDTFDIIQATPNAVEVSQGSLASPQISIRGIGGLGAIGGLDKQEGVGVFLDEVFIARPTGYPTFLFDVEQTEVVRGSQAVLYGKNTIGGAINLTTRKPGDDFTVYGLGGLGSQELREAQASADIPVVPGKLSARAFAAFSRQDGFIDNEFDGNALGEQKNFGGRFTALAKPTDDTRLTLALDYSRDRGEGFVFGPVEDALDFEVNFDQEPDEKRDIAGASVRLEHAFDDVALTSITAFRGYDYDIFLDGDFTPASSFTQGETQKQRQFTQELRASLAFGDLVDFTLGSFYMWEDFEGTQFFDFAAVPEDQLSRNSLDQQNQTISVFAESTVYLTETLDVTAGLRYTHERKDSTAEVESPSGTFLFGPPASASRDLTFNNVSPELTVSWQPTDNALGYFRVSRGYKGGGMTQFLGSGSANTYDPETTWSFELGTKAFLLDDRLSFEAAAFYIDWKDQQVLQFVGPGIGRNVTNAGTSTSRGFEVATTARLTPALGLSLGYGYLDARFDSFADPVTGEDFSDNDVPFAPRHSANVAARYSVPLVERITLTAGADYAFKSSYYFLADNDFEQEPTHLLDAWLTLERGPFSASVWAKNLLDEAYLAGYFQSFGVDMGSPARGRTYGVQVSVSF